MVRETIESDVLVIGAGIAGCRAAIEACDRGASVVLATKGLFGKDAGSTWMAFMSYECWGIYPHDTLDVQVEDVLRCGWFLNNQENVYTFLAHVPDTALELLKWGVRYKMKNGGFDTNWELGCSTPEGRAIYLESYPRGELGFHFARVFPRVVKSRKIDIIEDIFMVDLLSAGNSVGGAVGIDVRTGEFKVFKAKATILATGGYEGLYPITTANPNLTGDGQAMALRAGVDMTGFEFNQTLPSAIWPPQIVGSRVPFTLLMDWDAHMYNSRNERFLAKWDPVKMERTTRAVISRAIYHEIKEGKASPHGGIYTSVSHKSKAFLEEKIKKYQRQAMFTRLWPTGVDLSKDAIETGYAMHYCQGGCEVNSRCETDKSGLYAVGETASGAKDGADRMMGTALPYGMAMGIIAGREAAQRAMMTGVPRIDEAEVEAILARTSAVLERKEGIRVYQVKSRLQNIMAKETSYGRTEEGLKNALSEVERLKQEIIPRIYVPNKSRKLNFEWTNVLEFKNMLLVAECIIRNALMRNESRGSHDRWDYTAPDGNWFKTIHLRLQGGELRQWTKPVVFEYWQPEPGSLGEPWHRGVKIKEYRGWRAEPLFKRM